MPASFLMSEPTIVTVGADIVHDAQRITYTAYPSGVIFPLLFVSLRPDDWTPAEIAAQANAWADVWNTNAAAPGVESIAITQRVTAGGNLDDVAVVNVSSTSGRSTSEITISRADFPASRFEALTVRERVRLDEIEGASPPADHIGPG
jgi:hypothetical protein